MFDPERLLKQMVGGALGGAFGGAGRARRGLGSALGGNKTVVGLGLLGVAMAAYDHYSKAQTSSASTLPQTPVAAAMPSMSAAVSLAAMSPGPPPPPHGMSAPTRAQPMLDLHRQEAALMVRAMIAAAAADGSIDDAERGRILERARGAGDDDETLVYLQAELASPVALSELVAQTPRSLAEPVYAASLMAITLDSAEEHEYLRGLAEGLALTDERRAALHAQLGVA